MKQVTINIPESKYPFFMKLMKSLNFVKVVEPTHTIEDKLTADQKETWGNIKQGFEDLKLNEDGKLAFRPLQDVVNEL